MKYFFFILVFFFITDKAKYHLAFPLKWYKHGWAFQHHRCQENSFEGDRWGKGTHLKPCLLLSTPNQFRFSTKSWEKRLCKEFTSPMGPQGISHHSCCACSSMCLGYFVILLTLCEDTLQSSGEVRTGVQNPGKKRQGNCFPCSLKEFLPPICPP